MYPLQIIHFNFLPSSCECPCIAGFDCTHTFRCITLRVHSSLHAVGLTAAVSAELARHAVSANVVAGFYHDHVLVPAAQADAAVRLLEDLSLAANSS